jgi:hypothetical protein
MVAGVGHHGQFVEQVWQGTGAAALNVAPLDDGQRQAFAGFGVDEMMAVPVTSTPKSCRKGVAWALTGTVSSKSSCAWTGIDIKAAAKAVNTG